MKKWQYEFLRHFCGFVGIIMACLFLAAINPEDFWRLFGLFFGWRFIKRAGNWFINESEKLSDDES